MSTLEYGEVNDPRSASYVPSSDPDKDLIALTVYDTAGGCSPPPTPSTASSAKCTTALGMSSAPATPPAHRDALGLRRARTAHADDCQYLPQGRMDPANWVWSITNNRSKDGRGNPINHGTRFDRNLISDTSYNQGGLLVGVGTALLMGGLLALAILWRATSWRARLGYGLLTLACIALPILPVTIANRYLSTPPSAAAAPPAARAAR